MQSGWWGTTGWVGPGWAPRCNNASRMLQREDGVAGTIPVLAQRAASERMRREWPRLPFLLAERAR